MTSFNHEGFVVRRPDGRVLEDSAVSAHSCRLATTHSQLVPVPGIDGLHVRLLVREVKTISPGELRNLHERARTWYTARYETITNSATPDDTPEPLPDEVPLPLPVRKPKRTKSGADELE